MVSTRQNCKRPVRLPRWGELCLLLGAIMLLASPAFAESWPRAGDVQVVRSFSPAEGEIPLGDPCHVTWSVTPVVGQSLQGLFISEQYPEWLELEGLTARLDGVIVQAYLEIGPTGEVSPGMRPHRFVFWDVESGYTDFTIPEGSTLSIEYDLVSDTAGYVDCDANGWYGSLEAEPMGAVGGFVEGDPALQFGQTPLTLQSFTVTDTGSHLALSWRLYLEGEDEFFRLQRGESADPLASRPLDGEIRNGPGDYRYDDHAALPGRDYWYWLAMLDEEGEIARYLGPATGRLAGLAAPVAARLSGFPNPFNPTTVIRFELPEAGRVDLSIYDVHGRRLRTLVAGELSGGAHERGWDGRDDLGRELPSGSYFARLHRLGQEPERFKLVLLR